MNILDLNTMVEADPRAVTSILLVLKDGRTIQANKPLFTGGDITQDVKTHDYPLGLWNRTTISTLERVDMTMTLKFRCLPDATNNFLWITRKLSWAERLGAWIGKTYMEWAIRLGIVRLRVKEVPSQDSLQAIEMTDEEALDQ